MSRILAVIALAGVLVCAVIFNVRARQEAPLPSNKQAPGANEPIPVITERVVLGSIQETINAAGVVRSDRQSAIAARVPGRIVEILVREGARVSAGQTLVRLDLGDSRAQITGADAGVDGG